MTEHPLNDCREGQHPGEFHFRRLLEKLPAGAYTCDSEGFITYFNPAAERLWGRAPELNDPVDRFCGSFKLFAADGTPITHDQCWMALALRAQEGYNGCEIVIERPDGTCVTALAHANPIRDESGHLLGAVNVLVDISDRKRAEDALKQADRAKNEFLATLAHELRNPLAPIRNAVHILHLLGSSAPELQSALGILERQTKQMARLIDDLLDIARITGGRLELRRERIELGNVVRSAIETGRPLIESCGHELTVSVPGEPIPLTGDLTRLAQVISNLLHNAAKYTDRGGRIWLIAERQGSDAVVTVRDTGIGIPSEMIPRIFEMFTQVDRADQRSRGGLGVGLALVRQLVEMHGGSVSVRSDGPGHGSEFAIRLPVLLEQLAPERSTSESAFAIPAMSLRILVVDDNWDTAATLAVLLRSAGHNIRTAHDGLEAVSAAQEFQPEVILLDIGLPKLNGYDAARQIRALPGGSRMVLMAMTGWGNQSDRIQSKEAGFDHHLVKPVDPMALLQLLALVAQPAAM
ncbi:MAG: ATP-binding protein [Planctomycetia bacterium]|nr:ATP-binding protein [Planctomycetia bacterium]